MRGALVVLVVWVSACEFPKPALEGDANGGDAGGGSDGSGSDPVDPEITECPGAVAIDPAAPVCTVTAGSAGDGRVVVRGEVLLPGQRLRGGAVLVDGTGHIACTGCGCAAVAAAAGATVVDCQGGVVSPGLVNGLDHLSYAGSDPNPPQVERYEQRHDWRKGLRGHSKIVSVGGGTTAVQQWNELREVMSGTTSVLGSGGPAGLVRNLDVAANAGFAGKGAAYDTFPMGDSDATQRSTDCNYDYSTRSATADVSELQLAEGIDAVAHNEFHCLNAHASITNEQTGVLHGTGLVASELAALGSGGAGVVWTPRSDLYLYGDTLRVTTALAAGVQLGLGTDWIVSGSMNLLREMACAQTFSKTYLSGALDDEAIWKMATASAAFAQQRVVEVGSLRIGALGDLAVFDARVRHGFTAVVDAGPDDVALVMRGGVALYGDQATVTALRTGCEEIDACNLAKAACITPELGGTTTLASLTAANAASYPLRFCGAIPNEPTCVPARAVPSTSVTPPPASVNGSTVYSGAITATDADGDGILDAADSCPHVFNPIRPMDDGAQPDTDGDTIGDECDPCPTVHGTSCTSAPDDRDGDGVPYWLDNCPDLANPGQEDGDGDGKGFACDPCPSLADPGEQDCP